jgi:glycosyltransferase involved in cell wall biosynthesis
MANEYVIVDTGSTDGTLELLADWQERHPKQRVILDKVGSKFHDSEGVFDFGAAKDYAISLATCQYVMWVDVNDILKDGKHARSLFQNIVTKYPTAGISMLTRVTPTHSFPRLRILPRANAKFKGIIHEMVVNTDPDAPTVHTKIEFENYKPSRDIVRNLAGLRKSWEQERTQRTAFYFGNSYSDLKDYAHAYEWYSVAVDEFPEAHNEDRLKSMEQICAMIVATRTDLEELGYRSLQLIEEFPTRGEGYYYRARYNFEIGDLTFALKCLDKLMTLKPPKMHNLWLNNKIYDKEEIRSIIFMIKEEMQRDMSSQLMTADPIQPDIVDAGMPYGMYDGMPSQLNFGTTSPGFQEFI